MTGLRWSKTLGGAVYVADAARGIEPPAGAGLAVAMCRGAVWHEMRRGEAGRG